MSHLANRQAYIANFPLIRPVQSLTLQRACACGEHSGNGGECEECRHKREATLQRQAVGTTPARGVPPIVHEVLHSPGQPLDAATRAFMEPRFGHDFSQVRVHTDAKAAGSARAVNALAYTVGREVVFGAGLYVPGADEGRRLLAHELTHVMQQGGDVPRTDLRLGPPGDYYEQEADRLAASVQGAHVQFHGDANGSATGIQRIPGRLQRLGANPGCKKAEADGIHQAIFDARGWLNKAIPKLEEIPVSASVVASLRRNFGPTYGVAANATLIRDRLRVALGALGRIPFSCDTAGVTAPCVAQQCGWTRAGSNAATICTNPPSTLDIAWPRAADCVLHESLHASMPFMTVDNYKVNPGYPGIGTEPLLNAESYTKLTMDLS